MLGEANVTWLTTFLQAKCSMIRLSLGGILRFLISREKNMCLMIFWLKSDAFGGDCVCWGRVDGGCGLIVCGGLWLF